MIARHCGRSKLLRIRAQLKSRGRYGIGSNPTFVGRRYLCMDHDLQVHGSHCNKHAITFTIHSQYVH